MNIASKRNLKLSDLRAGLKEIPAITKRSTAMESKIMKLRQAPTVQTSMQKKAAALEGMLSSTSGDDISVQSDQDSNVFLEKYTLLQKVGEGCNAAVYKCIYKSTQKLYAVKKIKIQQEHIIALKRDFITLKEINHQSICRYKALYFAPNENTAYLVMEYLPYPSLATIKITSEEELRTIVREILSAISYLHKQNICHRDIKPDNILYDRKEKRLKLIDFGISKKTFLRGARREMLTIIGNPLYLAPQIYLGGGYDERIDLWSLGVTIYKLIAGCTPFESEYHSDTIANIVKGEAAFDSEIWSKFSPNLQCLVRRLLKKADERITVHQAEQSTWLLQSNSKQLKLRKTNSFNLVLHEHFHIEFNNNCKNAHSKEEGSEILQRPMFKSIKSLASQHFELEDSDDEDSVVTPTSQSTTKNQYESFSEASFEVFITITAANQG